MNQKEAILVLAIGFPRRFYVYPSDPSPCSTSIQDIDDRIWLNLEVDYRRKLIQKGRFEAVIVVGGNFRIGKETTYYRCPAYGFGEPYQSSTTGFGPVLGIQGRIPLPLHLEFTTEVRWTEYTFAATSPTGFKNFFQRANDRHILSKRFGLGFRF